MKTIAIVISSLLTLSAQVLAQTPKNIQTLKTQGVSVCFPSDWKAENAKDPIVYTICSRSRKTAFSVVRELKSEMGVADLREYFEFKLERILPTWENSRLGKPQSIVIGGKAAMLIEAFATVTDPKGARIPSKVYLATIEGTKYYYLVYYLAGGSDAEASGALLLEILDSVTVP